jgi:hypothetical protein
MSSADSESSELKFRAHLVDEATVVERGEQVKVWFVPFRDSWIRAKDHPDAELDEVSSEARSVRCPPGTIWQRRIDITLPVKTPLLCRVTEPLIETMGMIDYMTRERRGMRRHIDERWYALTGNYRLTRYREPESFSTARAEYEKNNKSRRN